MLEACTYGYTTSADLLIANSVEECGPCAMPSSRCCCASLVMLLNSGAADAVHADIMQSQQASSGGATCAFLLHIGEVGRFELWSAHRRGVCLCIAPEDVFLCVVCAGRQSKCI
jgi:hypothetical protein